MNFGTLELAVTNILRLCSKPESENAVMKKSFHEKVQRLQRLAGEHPEMVAKRDRWEKLIGRLEAIRDLRNHLSHSTLVHSVADDLKSVSQALYLTKDASVSARDAFKVTFEDLLQQNQVLADVVNDLAALDHYCEGAYKPMDGTIEGEGMWTSSANDR